MKSLLMCYVSIFRYLSGVIFLSFALFNCQFYVVCDDDCWQLNSATIYSRHLKQIQAVVWEFFGARSSLSSVVKSLTRQIHHWCKGLLNRWTIWCFVRVLWYLFCFWTWKADPQNATLVVLVLVVGISSLKIHKSFLICSGAQRNFVYTFLLTFPADVPSQIFKLFSN